MYTSIFKQNQPMKIKIEIGQNTRAPCLLADRWEDDGETMRGSGVGARGVRNRLVIAPTTNPGQSRYFAPLVSGL